MSDRQTINYYRPLTDAVLGGWGYRDLQDDQKLSRLYASPQEELRGVRSSIIGMSYDPAENVNTTDYSASAPLADGDLRLTAVLVPDAAICTGAVFYIETAGVFTADNENRFGLYELNEAATSLNLIASRANDGTGSIYKSAGLWFYAFASAVYVEPGIFYLGFLRNSSAVTTNPKMAARTAFTSLLTNPFNSRTTELRAGSLSAQTALPASVTLSGVSLVAVHPWVGIW